jgi:hypothetical protein
VVTRLILLIILGFVAALYFPDSRQAMYNRAMPVLEPMLIWNAEREIEELSRVVRREARETYQLPETRSWQSWMTVNFSANATSDPWGKQYYYQAWPDSFHIRSDGPDRMHQSEDDIGVTQHKPF